MGFFQNLFQKLKKEFNDARLAEETKYREQFGDGEANYLTEEEKAQLPVDGTESIEQKYENSYNARKEKMRATLRRYVDVDENEAAKNAAKKNTGVAKNNQKIQE